MKKYSIVLFLEDESKAEVRQLQEKLFELTGSQECLNNWRPHLTVGDGISVSEEELVIVENDLQTLANSQDKFEISLTDFGGKTDRVGGKGEVTTPYVLWVDVEITTNLESLVEKVKEKITSKYDLWYQMPQPYTPHVTIAFRDLTKEGYKKGKKYLEEISFKKFVQVSNIALVEKLPESDIEYKRFQFTSK